MDRVGLPIPSGTVTFLFSDIEGSTVRWERDSAAMHAALRRHDALLHAIVAEHGGHVFKTVGDEFCTVFSTPVSAVTAALAIQQGMQREDWSAIGGLRVRMAAHTGVTDERNGDYYGRTVNRVARLMAAGHGGQVLLSAATAELTRATLPAGCGLLSLGEHRLKDLLEDELIYQLTHPDLPAEFPPLKTLDAQPNNLPLQVTAFFGREGELSEARRLLEKTRLLTLAGTGGVGKTRLALQLAANVADEFPDGVWFCDLSSLTDGAVVASAVAAAMSIREESGTTVAQTLIRTLKEKRALVVLDNCEQIIDDCAKLADVLQRGCLHLHIIATSREFLNISGEVIYRVPAISSREAVEFFSSRAEMVAPDFKLSDENAANVAQICGRLDGLPMAIELAAARVRTMSVKQLAKHLDDRFRVLTGGSRTASARQQTLSGLIGWSYGLLAEPERATLRRLAVFGADFDLEAATAIAAAPPVEDWECFDIISRLVDKSLINAEPSGDELRYRFLESTREYARERLREAGESEDVFRRHAGYWFAQVDALRVSQLKPQGARDRARLSREYANVRAVLAWAITEQNDIAFGSDIAAGLRLFWHWRGLFREGLYWFEALLERVPPRETRARGLALLGVATMHNMDRNAREPIRAALAIFEELGDVENANIARSNLTTALIDVGDFEEARELFEIQLVADRKRQQSPHIVTLYNFARLYWNLRMDALKAGELAGTGLELARPTGAPYLTFILTLIGRIATYGGDYAQALSALTEAIDLGRSLEMGTHVAHHLLHRANLYIAMDQCEDARRDLRDACDMLEKDRVTLYVAAWIDASANFAAALEHWDEVTRLAGFSDAFLARESIVRGMPEQTRLDKVLSGARRALGDAAFENARVRGAALDLDAAVLMARSTLAESAQ